MKYRNFKRGQSYGKVVVIKTSINEVDSIARVNDQVLKKKSRFRNGTICSSSRAVIPEVQKGETLSTNLT